MFLRLILPRTALLNFGHVELKKAVDPCQQLLPGNSDSVLQHLVSLHDSLTHLDSPIVGGEIWPKDRDLMRRFAIREMWLSELCQWRKTCEGRAKVKGLVDV